MLHHRGRMNQAKAPADFDYDFICTYAVYFTVRNMFPCSILSGHIYFAAERIQYQMAHSLSLSISGLVRKRIYVQSCPARG